MLTSFAPIIAASLSFLTALIVACIGYFNARSLESKKQKVAYLNYALGIIMDEYIKCDPTIKLIDPTPETIIAATENAFENSCECIRRAAPFLDISDLHELKKIEVQRSQLLKNQINARLQKLTVDQDISADLYLSMLDGYNRLAQDTLKQKAFQLRKQLEEGL